MKHPDIYGSAVWADPNVIGRKFAYDEKRDFWIGRNPYEYGQSLGYDDDRHVFLCAGTGSGKGRSIVVNNLLNWRGSIVSVDPKGENASICATRRANGDEFCDGLRQKTYVLDPYNVVKDIPDELRASCNLLDLLDPLSPSLLEDAKFLAEAMRMTEPGAESESWSKDSASITGLVIAHVISHPMFRASQRNLVTVRKLIQKGDKKYVEDAKEKNKAERILAEREEREPRLIKVPTPHEALFMLMDYNDAQDRALADEAEAYIDLMKTNPKQWGSLIKGARDETAFIDSLNMKRQLRPDPEDRRIFSLKDLVHDKKGISIFISLPDDPELSAIRWQKALLLLIHRYMRREQEDPATGLKVLMCMDEFASMGKMPEFPRSMTAVRSSGIKMFVIVTNITGIKELYQGAFGDIMQGCTLQIFMDCADPETRAYIEEHFGEAQIIMTARGGSVSVNQSEGVQTTDGFSQGVSVQHSRGTSDATSYSKSLARSDSHSFSNAISDVETWNDAEGESSSETIGSQSSWQLSSAISKNSNWQDSKNRSRSNNRSYNTSSAFGVSHNNYAWFKPFLKSTNDTRQNGRSHGSQSTTGESSSIGGSEGETNTQSTGGGQNKAHTLGRQITKSKGGSKGQTETRGRTQGQTDTETYGASHTLSETYSQGWTESYSRSQGKSFQEGITLSANWQENILKRPLITRDEANLFLARVDEREHPAYPGMMLVQISGQSPFLARRCHYDEDPEFEGKYRPLPKYRDKYLPYSKQRLVGGAYTEDHFLPIRLPPPIADAKEAINVTINVDTDVWFSAGDQLFTWKGPTAERNRKRWERVKTQLSKATWLNFDTPESPKHPEVNFENRAGTPQYSLNRAYAPADGKLVDYALTPAYKQNSDIMYLRFERPILDDERAALERAFFGGMLDYLIEKQKAEGDVAKIIKGYEKEYKNEWSERRAKAVLAEQEADKKRAEKLREEREQQATKAREHLEYQERLTEVRRQNLIRPFSTLAIIFLMFLPFLNIVGYAAQVTIEPDSIETYRTYKEKRFKDADGVVDSRCRNGRVWGEKDLWWGQYSYSCDVPKGWYYSHPRTWYIMLFQTVLLCALLGLPFVAWFAYKRRKDLKRFGYGLGDVFEHALNGAADRVGTVIGNWALVPWGLVIVSLIIYQNAVGAVF